MNEDKYIYLWEIDIFKIVWRGEKWTRRAAGQKHKIVLFHLLGIHRNIY